MYCFHTSRLKRCRKSINCSRRKESAAGHWGLIRVDSLYSRSTEGFIYFFTMASVSVFSAGAVSMYSCSQQVLEIDCSDEEDWRGRRRDTQKMKLSHRLKMSRVQGRIHNSLSLSLYLSLSLFSLQRSLQYSLSLSLFHSLHHLLILSLYCT